MKIALYSDLHGVLPDVVYCDVAIVAGDVCPNGPTQVQRDWLEGKFRGWLSKFSSVVWVAGNHDHCCLDWSPHLGDHVHYLKDSSTTIDGVTFWGSPRSLTRMGFATSDADLASILEPARSADVVILHSPPYGLGDRIRHTGERVGSKSLLGLTQGSNPPRLVVCGHIHECRGVYKSGSSVVVNAAMGMDRKTPFIATLEVDSLEVASLKPHHIEESRDLADVGNGVFVGRYQACDSVGREFPLSIHIHRRRDDDSTCQRIMTGVGDGLVIGWKEEDGLDRLSVPFADIVAYAKQPGDLLVHCHAGVCRSTLLALACKIARGCDPWQGIADVNRGQWRDRRHVAAWNPSTLREVLDWWEKDSQPIA